jgi:hypothetical protein
MNARQYSVSRGGGIWLAMFINCDIELLQKTLDKYVRGDADQSGPGVEIQKTGVLGLAGAGGVTLLHAAHEEPPSFLVPSGACCFAGGIRRAWNHN